MWDKKNENKEKEGMNRPLAWAIIWFVSWEQNGTINIQRCSFESQKGTINIQRCSFENKKVIITVQYLWQ